MTKERLEEIRDSIKFQMLVQREIGHKNRYDDVLIEKIDLYNKVVDLQNKIYKALEYMKDFTFENLLTFEDRKLIMYNANLTNFEKILKGENYENN